ncbi:MAG TPA: hypothetical protein VHE35_03005 [Kofleriaceae bacterium]|nr:hypothetical protein [Kofleriaceae bacterium]
MARPRSALVLVVAAAACHGGHAPPPTSMPTSPTEPTEPTAPAAAPIDAGLAQAAPAPAPDAAPPPAAGSPEAYLADLEANKAIDAVCFARAGDDAAMCAVDTQSIQGGATFAVRILGDGARDLVYYEHPQDQQFFDIDPSLVDHAVFADARARVASGHFTPWAGPDALLEPGGTLTVGTSTLRRTRKVTGHDGDPMTGRWDVSRDVIELRCGKKWKPVPFTGAVFGNEIEPPTTRVGLLGDKLVFTAAVSWGIEGDHGGGDDAAMIDPAAVCR